MYMHQIRVLFPLFPLLALFILLLSHYFSFSSSEYYYCHPPVWPDISMYLAISENLEHYVQ
jgi:hypothetical protein